MRETAHDLTWLMGSWKTQIPKQFCWQTKPWPLGDGRSKSMWKNWGKAEDACWEGQSPLWNIGDKVQTDQQFPNNQ
jgi:hypothetical protein